MAANSRAVLEVDIEVLRGQVLKFCGAEMAGATEAGYAHDWRTFSTWCARAGLARLPASPETLSLFIADQLARKKVATVARYVAGICYIHRREGFPSPQDESVRKTLAGARRMRCEQPRQMRPLTVVQLREIAQLFTRNPTPQSTRNGAIIVLGFATALRRSSLASLNLEDVAFCDEGLTVYVRREKQDRRGDGRVIAVPFGHEPTCPVRSLGAWLAIRGTDHGPLFTRLDQGTGGFRLGRLSSNALWKIVKAAVASIGLDPDEYGPHSLRAGLITEAGIAGVCDLVIAQHSGHKSLDSLKRYFRPSNLFKANCSSLVGL